MSKINILDWKIANKIAAGEVVANPASIVKELIENSIDANSSIITVEIKKGGKDLILVKDNGIGISNEDALVAFKRHATSKIKTMEDLTNISTLGFRGEALASIAAISKVTLKSKERSSDKGVYIKIHGGKIIENSLIGCSFGTIIKVEEIFYNTPARYKYLKSHSIEAGNISLIIERLALSHPEISFKFINEGREIFHTPGNKDLYSTIFSLFGKDFCEDLIEMDYENSPMKVKGYIGKPQLTRTTRKYQIFFINNRFIKNNILNTALDEAYKGLVMIHKYPVAILNINLPSHMLDVNVHPAKTDVLFRNESLISLLLKQAIIDCLKENSLITEIKLNNRVTDYKEYDNDTQEQIPIETVQQIYNNFSILDKKYTFKEEGNYEPKKTIIDKLNFPDYKDKENILYAIKNGRIIGQIFFTYIIIELERELFLIDQHAAHERIAYDQLKEEFENNNIISQSLLFPKNIQLSFEEYQTILNYKTTLKKLGYDIEEFGNNSILLRSVPIILGKPQNEDNLFELIDYLSQLKKVNISQEIDQKLISKACKSAVKAFDKLENKEIKRLIKDLANTENPYTCPHGRPTIVKISSYELERLFKRIQ
ncbi:MAG TPA: DNA mismatch repair endonuclease MutL [Eubacteriaceae bacterium]|nr:DNA mismatch repair endonuclease MutL [Eubacteriaceae bacterium]